MSMAAPRVLILSRSIAMHDGAVCKDYCRWQQSCDAFLWPAAKCRLITRGVHAQARCRASAMRRWQCCWTALLAAAAARPPLRERQRYVQKFSVSDMDAYSICVGCIRSASAKVATRLRLIHSLGQLQGGAAAVTAAQREAAAERQLAAAAPALAAPDAAPLDDDTLAMAQPADSDEEVAAALAAEAAEARAAAAAAEQVHTCAVIVFALVCAAALAVAAAAIRAAADVRRCCTPIRRSAWSAQAAQKTPHLAQRMISQAAGFAAQQDHDMDDWEDASAPASLPSGDIEFQLKHVIYSM